MALELLLILRIIEYCFHFAIFVSPTLSFVPVPTGMILQCLIKIDIEVVSTHKYIKANILKKPEQTEVALLLLVTVTAVMKSYKNFICKS